MSGVSILRALSLQGRSTLVDIGSVGRHSGNYSNKIRKSWVVGLRHVEPGTTREVPSMGVFLRDEWKGEI